jgi:hypothetical protein
MTKMLEKFWLPIILAIIALVSTLAVPFISTIMSNRASAATTTNSFVYQVRVETKTGNQLPNAQVILEIAGKAPLDSVSDTNGLAQIFVETSYVGKPGKLIVKIAGYKSHTQFINLIESALPQVVQLDPVP